MTQRNDSALQKDTHAKMSADIYDAGNIHKDYRAETDILKTLIRSHKQTEGNALLDVGCGTGKHLLYLTDSYAITGVDLSEQQLQKARKRLPALSFVQGDMRDFSLDTKFDVVTCLFSAIGYVYPYEDMKKAVANLAAHLRPGGVLLVEPWLMPGEFDPSQSPQTYHGELPDEDLAITVRIYDHQLDGNIASMKMHHTVKRMSGTEEFTVEHKTAMYTTEEFRDAFESAGLDVTHDKHGLDGRGLFIGRKPIDR